MLEIVKSLYSLNEARFENATSIDFITDYSENEALLSRLLVRGEIAFNFIRSYKKKCLPKTKLRKCFVFNVNASSI